MPRAKTLSQISLTSAQKEGFLWFLSRKPGERRAKDISEQFGISIKQAEAWLTAFNKLLDIQVTPKIKTALKTYVKEFELVQQRTLEGGSIASEIYSEMIREISEKPDDIDHKKLKEALNGLQTVYKLTEAASMADVAKRQAARENVLGGNSGAPEASFEIGQFAEKLGITLDSPEDFTEENPDSPLDSPE